MFELDPSTEIITDTPSICPIRFDQISDIDSAKCMGS